MRLFSALLRLCLLYFVFTADKGLGNTKDLSSYSSSSSSSASDDVLAVVPGRGQMEIKGNVVLEKRSEDSVKAASKDGE